MSYVPKNRDYVNLQHLKTPLLRGQETKIERMAASAMSTRNIDLQLLAILFFDLWPLAIDIDFAFGKQPLGAKLPSRPDENYLSLSVSPFYVMLPAVRLRKLQTPFMFLFSCVFFLSLRPTFRPWARGKFCLSFQWARQKPNSDSVSNSPNSIPVRDSLNVLFDWASHGLNIFNLGYITLFVFAAGKACIESFSLCDKKSIPFAQSKGSSIKTKWHHKVSLTSIVAFALI